MGSQRVRYGWATFTFKLRIQTDLCWASWVNDSQNQPVLEKSQTQVFSSVKWELSFFPSQRCGVETKWDNYQLPNQIRSDQSLIRVWLFATPWITARQASLSITNYRSSLRLTSIESVMPSSHLILCRPLLLLPPSLPASEYFPMSQLFAWGGQSTGVSALASLLPKNTQGWSPWEWTGWISLQSKGLSRIFSNTTVQKHQFFVAQPSSQSNSHIHTWPQEKPLECKSRKSRNTWSNRQIWPWNMEWSRANTNRVLPRKCTGHNKHPLPTTKEKTLYMDITRWSTPKSDWLYSLQPKIETLYTVSKNKTRSWLWLRPWTPYWQIQMEIEESRENHKTIQVWPKSNPLWLYSGSEK